MSDQAGSAEDEAGTSTTMNTEKPRGRVLMHGEDWERARKWIEEKGSKLFRCGVCEETALNVFGQMHAIPVWNHAELSIPVIVVGCNGCGSIQFVDAVKIGLVEPDERLGP